MEGGGRTTDTFSGLVGAGGATYNFSETGIAWPSDKNKYGVTAYTNTTAVPPPNWAVYNGCVSNASRARTHRRTHRRDGTDATAP